MHHPKNSHTTCPLLQSALGARTCESSQEMRSFEKRKLHVAGLLNRKEWVSFQGMRKREDCQEKERQTHECF